MTNRTKIFSKTIIERRYELIREWIRQGKQVTAKTLSDKDSGIGISFATAKNALYELSAVRNEIKYSHSKYSFIPSDNFPSRKQNDVNALINILSLLDQYRNLPNYDDIKEILSLLNPEITNYDIKSNVISIPPLPEYIIDKNKWNTILSAINKRHKISFFYKGQKDNDFKKRTCCPYQILLEDGNCIIYGLDDIKKENRLFILSRMKNILELHTTFELPQNWTFDSNYGGGKFGAYTFGAPENYKIKFSGEAQTWVKEHIWGHNQTITNDSESLVLSFTSSQDDKILEWILSCGNLAVPLEPEKFVERWKNEIKEMAKMI